MIDNAINEIFFVIILEVWSKLYVKEGFEIHLEPKMSGMTPEQVREFCRRVIALATELSGGDDEN